MKKSSSAVTNYYVLPCCLLLLNLANSLVGYKAELIEEPLLRTLAVIFFVLCGSSLVAYVLAPAIGLGVNTLLRSGRRNGGQLGETLALLVLGAVVFWGYYLLCNHGAASLLPKVWRNA
jgi:predicted membrane channel-forming protein YqfA (hemolysin III family)